MVGQKRVLFSRIWVGCRYGMGRTGLGRVTRTNLNRYFKSSTKFTTKMMGHTF